MLNLFFSLGFLTPTFIIEPLKILEYLELFEWLIPLKIKGL